jgi:hypothetical protein
MAPGIVLERPDPPVFSLPRDVLEEILIFRVNNKPPVLRDIKSMSQVCRHWREIIVDWPSLWGRAISVDELNQVRDDWRTEVVRRTKTSALHIFGNLEDLPTFDFVLSLMESQWSRIRRLELDIVDSLPSQGDYRWRALLRPAPLLQSFVLDIRRSPHAARTSSRNPLFGGHAPQLDTFVPSAIHYNLQGSWTSTLRRLELSFTHPFTIPQLLEALKRMQQLEHLELNPNGFQGNPNNVDQFTTLPHVCLPHLEYIQMEYARFWTPISLLDHIHPASACALNFSIVDLKIPTEERFGELQRLVSRYTENHYGRGIATNFHLERSSSHFSITDPASRKRPMSIEWAFPESFVANSPSLFPSHGFSNVKNGFFFDNSDYADDIDIANYISCYPFLKTLYHHPDDHRTYLRLVSRQR